MLSLRNVSAGYGRVAVVHDISLSCEAGEVVALLGPNGAGKSTTLKTISGLLTPSSGAIELDGKDISRTTPRERVRRGLTHIPEGRGIFKSLSVEQNLRLGVYARRLSPTERLRRVYALFPVLEERRGSRAGLLSGGQQQMVALGRGLMSDPEVLLLDEPCQGLSPLLAGEVMARVRQIATELNTAVLIGEQNAVMALKAADRLIVMQGGRIVLRTSATEISSPKELEKAYFGSD